MLMLAGYVASRASVKSAAFDIVAGVGKSLPLAGALFLIGSLGLAGIPPTIPRRPLRFHSLLKDGIETPPLPLVRLRRITRSVPRGVWSVYH